MAFSQAEIASNPSFDCILRDHNRRDRYGRESRLVFQKNLKDLVRDRLQSCISSPSIKSDSDSNENKNPPMENVESKSHHIPRKSKASERWNRAKEMVLVIENPGVSSLVKKWRDFEDESKSKSTNKSHSSSPVNEKFEDSRMNDERLPINESDTTVNSGSRPTSSADGGSDGAESERIKVADIIQKLKNENSGKESIRAASDPTEKRGSCQVLCCPRIRGRQALSDLLIRMGRDRLHELEVLGERKPVSRFSHRGRIQALLRVKLLCRGSEFRDNRLSSPTMCKLNGVARGSTIMHLRERFSVLVDHCSSNPTLIDQELPDFDNSSTSNRTEEDLVKTHEPEKPSDIDQHQFTPSASRLEDELDITTTSPQPEIATSKRPREEIQCLEVSDLMNHPKELIDKTSNFEDSSMSKRPREEICDCEVTSSNYGKEEDKNTIQITCTSREFVPRESKRVEADKKHLEDPQVAELVNDFPSQNGDWEEQEVNTEIRETDDESCSSDSHSEGEEEMMVGGNNNEWIYDIARPKSDWEGLRKARYQEMLDPYMENGDIQVLLQRRSVSTFLSSGLKERLERVMVSRTQGLQPPLRFSSSEERSDQFHYKQGQEDDEYDDEEEVYDEEEEDEDDDYKDGEYFDCQPSLSSLNSTAPTLFRTWGSNRSVDFDHLASPLSNSCSQSSCQHSIEMELIYDLKGYMEQLHQEMSEIRKSVKSCISMQAKLQRSIKKEVTTAVNNSVRRDGNESYRRVQENGNCCICRKMPIDSLLYRCGHMCTCFKCGHELQRSGGKCPICTAPILDIVRPAS